MYFMSNRLDISLKMSKAVIAFLAVVAVGLGCIGLSNVPKAHAAISIDLATIVAAGSDSSDSTTACDSGSAACWSWDSTSKTLSVVDDADAVIDFTGFTMSDDLTIQFTDLSGAPLAGAAASSPSISWTGTLTVASGKTLTVGEYTTLTGDIFVEKGATLTGDASAAVVGNITNYGTISTLDVSGANVTQGADNKKKGVCDANQAGIYTGSEAHIATSTGNPAEDVWCDVTVKMVIPETISLQVNAAETVIPSPVITASNPSGFQESASDGLIATVNTNSSDGYKLSFRGVSSTNSPWTGVTAGCAAEIDMCSVNAAGTALLNKIVGSGFTVPAAATAATNAAWGFRSAAGAIVDDEYDGVCSGRMVTGDVVTASTDVSDAAVNKTDCEDTSGTSADETALAAIDPTNTAVDTVDTAGTWTPNSGDGSTVTTPTVADATAGTTVYAPIPDVDTALTAANYGGSGSVASMFAADTDASVYTKPVVSAKTWFRFGAVIKASTSAGEYKGKVRITATPSVQSYMLSKQIYQVTFLSTRDTLQKGSRVDFKHGNYK